MATTNLQWSTQPGHRLSQARVTRVRLQGLSFFSASAINGHVLSNLVDSANQLYLDHVGQ